MKLFPWDKLTDKVDLLLPELAEDILFHLLLLLIAILKKDCSVLMFNSPKRFHGHGNNSVPWNPLALCQHVCRYTSLENCFTMSPWSSKIKMKVVHEWVKSA